MSFRYSVSSDFSKLESWVNSLAGRHLPYVMARTLTDLAGAVNQESIRDLRKYFILRNKYVVRSFRRVPAEKKQWPSCFAEAGSVAAFMELQVLGGVKTNKSGGVLGIPESRGQSLGGRPNPTDIIRKPLWVQNLVQRRGYILVTGKVSTSTLLLKQVRAGHRRNKNHLKNLKRKKHHTGQRGWQRETIYTVKKNVKIPARFPFYEIAKRTVQERYMETFKSNLNHALSESK